MYHIILNATDELLSKLNHNRVLKIHTFFSDMDDLMCSTERKAQSKQAEFVRKITKSIEMLREVREKLCIRDTSSQIGGKVINADARVLDKIKNERMNAIAFATHLVAVLNQIHCKNEFPRVVTDFAQPSALVRIYVKNATLDNAIPECGCVLRRSIGTQSNIANEEFSSEASLDAPEKASGKKKRRVDFIPEEIAKVSDTLTAEARLTCDVVTEDTALYARKPVILMADGTEEKTFRGRESLISPVIDAKEESDIAEATDVATDAMQREFSPIRVAGVPRDCSALSDETFQVSGLDESLDAPRLLPIEEMRMHGDVMSVERIEKDDSLDIAAITAVVTSEKKGEGQKEQESSSNVSLQLMMDKGIPVVDKTALDVTVGSMITDLAEESTIPEPAYPAKDTLEESTSTEYKMPLSEKARAINGTEVKHSPRGESTPPAQDMFSESVQIKHKMPRRGKTRVAKKTDVVESSPVGKPTQPAKDTFQESVRSTYGMPRFRKARTIEDTAFETSPAGEEYTQLTKDTFRDSARAKYKASRFKKTRTIEDIGNETSPAGELAPLANDDVLRKPIQEAAQQTTRNAARRYRKSSKGIESRSTNTFASYAWPKTTRWSCDYLERSTTVGRDCRQLRILQPRCCGRRSRYHDALRASSQHEATRNAASDHTCYPPLQDPRVSGCRGGYWWWLWGRACDTYSPGKYASVGNSLHTHAYCNGDTGHYCPHLNAIDNCRTGHCHWDGGRSVWYDERHYGRS